MLFPKFIDKHDSITAAEMKPQTWKAELNEGMDAPWPDFSQKHREKKHRDISLPPRN